MDRWFIVVIETQGVFIGIMWIWRLYMQALEQTARVVSLLRLLKQPVELPRPRKRRKAAKAEEDVS